MARQQHARSGRTRRRFVTVVRTHAAEPGVWTRAASRGGLKGRSLRVDALVMDGVSSSSAADSLSAARARVAEIRGMLRPTSGASSGSAFAATLAQVDRPDPTGVAADGTSGAVADYGASAAGRWALTGASGYAAASRAREAYLAATGATTGIQGAGSGAHAHAGAPAELAAFGNGRIPAAALDRIGVGGHKLWGPAAASFQSLTRAARADGVNIAVTDSYRSYDQQVDVAQRKGLYKNGGLAATPGTSTHGWGLSVDLDLDSRAQAWMRANAGRFGFVEDVAREPWHWTFSAQR